MPNHEDHGWDDVFGPPSEFPVSHKDPQREPPLDPRHDPGNYILRAFYHNPKDKSLMVPMRYGSGVDFNYARWPGRVVVALVVVGIIWVLVTLFI